MLLKDKIQSLSDKEMMGIEVYAILKENDDVRRLDIQDKYSNDLRDYFVDSIQKVADDEREILVLSNYDDRRSVAYLYDLAEKPSELELLSKIHYQDKAEQKLFDLASGFQNIKALIMKIGNDDFTTTLYKILAPINIFSPAQFLFIKSGTQLKRIDEEFLRFSNGFQIIQIQDEIYIIDLKILENFQFFDILKQEAEKGIKAIENMNIIDNIEVFEELLEDVSFARKLTNVSRNSPVIQAKISNHQIIDFCSNYPLTKGKIKFNGKNDKIILDTKKSRELFLKILMDNLLTSELTKHCYESIAKNTIDT